MKRYAIVEVPDTYPGMEWWDDRNEVYVPVLKGPVELMQAATREAGVVVVRPKAGDTYCSLNTGKWLKATHDWDRACAPCPVIPADPDPEPCPNCQGAKYYNAVACKWREDRETRVCLYCDRPESEWTYAPDPEPCKCHSSRVDANSLTPGTRVVCNDCGRVLAERGEPEPCQNCQGIQRGRTIWAAQYGSTSPKVCAHCGKPESEWTYVPEPEWGGIGGGVL